MLEKRCLYCSQIFTKPRHESLINWEHRHKFCSRNCVNKYKTGKKLSKLQRKRISDSLKEAYKEKRREGFKKGHKHSEQWHKVMAGRVPWNKGKKTGLVPKNAFEKGRKAPPTAFKKGHVPFYKGKPNPKIRGENHWNWKGGVPKKQRHRELNYKDYRKYLDWQKAVFKRDNWKCQFCGKHGGILHADHIKPWASYPDLRFVLKNGRTLCPTCHRKTDTYGKKSQRAII